MTVSQSPAVEIAIRTLSDQDRQKVFAWFSHLGNWENDKFVRDHSVKLSSSDSIYVLNLKKSSDFRIFFRLEGDHIEILDIATKSTIMKSGRLVGAEH